MIIEHILHFYVFGPAYLLFKNYSKVYLGQLLIEKALFIHSDQGMDLFPYYHFKI